MGVTEQQQETPRPADPPRHRGRLPSGFTTIRDLLTFTAGLGFIGNEVFISENSEPAIIAVGAAMMGLPLVFGADERKRGKGGEPPAPPTGGEAS